jgi:hypothetical protein
MVVDLHVVVPQGDPDALERGLEACIEAGLDGVCLLGEAVAPPVEAARASRFAARLALFFGVRFPVDRGVLLWLPADPAVLADEPWRAAPPRDAAGVTALADAHGGVVLAAHPYDRTRGDSFGDGIFNMVGLTGIEVANARQDRFRNNMAVDATLRTKTSAFGGTASDEVERIGRAATVFLEVPADQAALVEALRRSDTWAVEFLASLDEALSRDEGRSGRAPDRRPQGRRDGGSRDRGRGRSGHAQRQGGNRR